MTKANYSIIDLSSCIQAKRIDAEYFRPDYLDNEQVIFNKENNTLDEIASDIKSYGAYSLTNQISYKETGIPYIRCTDVKEGYVDFSQVLFIDEKSNELLWKSEVKEDMVLLCMSGSVGNTAVAGKNWLYPINSNQDLAKIILKNNINPYYVSTFFNSSYGKKQILRLPIGSVQQHIFIWQIKTLLIPKASDDFQNKIAELVTTANKSRLLAEETFTAVTRQLEQDLGFHMLNTNHPNYSIKNFKDFQNSNRLDGEYWLPKYDEIENQIKSYMDGYDTIDKLVKISSLTSHIDADKNYSYVELANVNATVGLVENPSELSGSELPSRARMKLKKNDIVLSSIEGSADKVAIIKDERDNLVGSTGFFVLQEDYLLPEVILALFRVPHLNELFRRQAQGTILTAIPRSSVSRMILPKLAKPYQELIAKQINDAHEMHEASKRLMKTAKEAVEIFIEVDEQKAFNFIEENNISLTN